MTFIAKKPFPNNVVSAENPTPITFLQPIFILKNTREMTNPLELQPFLCPRVPASCLGAYCPSAWRALQSSPVPAAVSGVPRPEVVCRRLSTQCARSARISAKELMSGTGSFEYEIWISK